MSRRRWIADEFSGNRAALTGAHARHLSQVLRVQVGQEFELSINGEVRLARVLRALADRVEFEVGAPVPSPAPLALTVLISVFKFDRMEWAIEKCTELGVANIIPVLAARTDSHLASAAAKRAERWRRIAQQASEQSRRTTPPEVAAPAKLKDVLSIGAERRVVLSEVEQASTLADILSTKPASLALAFGPEGGWKEQELTAFAEAGWTSASLGPTILRAETAVIAAVAVAASVMASEGREPLLSAGNPYPSQEPA